MGRYVTRAGVEIEMGDDAARVVGYAPVKSSAKSAPTKDDKPQATRSRSTSTKKSD